MPQKPSYRILVVDDNRDGADSTAMMLKIMGNETRTAYDGLQAFQAAADFQPDIVLLDLGLPTLSGCEVCRRIRSEPWGKEMTIFAVTGWSQDDDHHNTQAAGFNHHLVKPVDPMALLKLIAVSSTAS